MLSIASLMLVASLCENEDFDRWNGFLNFVHSRPETETFYNVHVTFSNEASDPVDLYKVRSFKSQLNPMGLVEATLQPGEKKKISCMAGDTFTARVNSPKSPRHDLLLLAHDVSMVHLHENDCQGEKRRTLVKCIRKEFTADQRWTPPDSLMFHNHLQGPASIFYADTECQELVARVPASETHHIQSTLGHTFHIRDEADELVQKHTLREVSIRDLSTEEDHNLSDKASNLFDVVHLKILTESKLSHDETIRKLEQKMSQKTEESRRELERYIPDASNCN